MSFILLLAYIAAIYIRPQEWLLAIYGWPLIDILAVITALFLVFELSQTRNFRINKPQNALLVCFLGSIVLSHLSHTYFWGAYSSLLAFGKTVIMFFLFVNVLNSKNRLRITIWAIVFLTALLAVQSIYQFKTGFGWAGQPLIVDSGTIRTTWVGIFNDPNDLALAFVIAIGFLMAFIFGNTRFFAKIIGIPLLGLLMYVLYLANSRGAYLALMVTIVYYFLRKIRHKAFALIIGGIFVFLILIAGPSRLASLSAHESSAFGRIDAWYQGFQMLKSAPLFGVGYGMFTDYHHLTAHNSYILIAAEEGLFGLFIWVALIYACFKGLYIVSAKNKEAIAYVSGVEAGLVGFLSASFFLSRAYIPILYIMLALAAAYTFTLLKKEDYRFTFKDAKISAVLSIGILAITWISMKISLRILG